MRDELEEGFFPHPSAAISDLLVAPRQLNRLGSGLLKAVENRA